MDREDGSMDKPAFRPPQPMETGYDNVHLYSKNPEGKI